MRVQRRAPVTVTLVRTTAVAKDRLGNRTAAAPRVVIDGAIFDPAQAVLERDGAAQSAVLQAATFNLPGAYDVQVDDLVQVGAYPAPPAGAVDEWQVIGGGIALDAGRTRVPVTQTRSA